VDVKPIGCHRAELMLLDLGLVFQVGLARTKRNSVAFRGCPAPEKRCVLALGQVCDLGAKARSIWLAKRDGLGAAAEGCQNLERSSRRTAATVRLPHGNRQLSRTFTIEEDSALTFDLSGVPKARPLEGMVRRLIRADLLLLRWWDTRGCTLTSRTQRTADALRNRSKGTRAEPFGHA